MCDYVNKNELIKPREIFSEWISNVQSEIKKKYGITFDVGKQWENIYNKTCKRIVAGLKTAAGG